MLKIKRILTQSQKGMTLIELMIAVFILALVAVGLFHGFTVAFQAMADAKDRTVAINYAQQILENFKNTDFDKLDYLAASMNGKPIDGTKFSPNIPVREIQDDLKEIIVEVSWKDRNKSPKDVTVYTKISRVGTTKSLDGDGDDDDTQISIVIYAEPYNLLPDSDKPSRVYAKIVDEQGNKTTNYDGESVTFSAKPTDDEDDGIPNNRFGGFTISKHSETTSIIVDGIAETQFYPSSLEGYVTLKASFNGKSDTIDIRITEEAVAIRLSSKDKQYINDKYIISTGGGEEGIAHLMAEIIDAGGNVVTDDNREIRFDKFSGPDTSSLVNLIPTQYGIAKIDLVAGTDPGTCTIIATADFLEPDIIDIEIVDPDKHTIEVWAEIEGELLNEPLILQGSADIVAKLTDYLDKPLSGEPINFEIETGSDLGNISQSSGTTGENGEATTILTMNHAGTIKIKASWVDDDNNEISATVGIECKNHILSIWEEGEEETTEDGCIKSIFAELKDYKGNFFDGKEIVFEIYVDESFVTDYHRNTISEGRTSSFTVTLNNTETLIVYAYLAGYRDEVNDEDSFSCSQIEEDEEDEEDEEPRYPIVEATNIGSTSNTKTHNIKLPSNIQNGELLVILLYSNNNENLSIPGWTNKGSSFYSKHSSFVFYKIADGSNEGASVTGTTPKNTTTAYISIRINNWSDIALSSAFSGDTKYPDPPEIISAGEHKTLYFAIAGGDENKSVNRFPSGYGEYLQQSADSCWIATARKEAEIGIENPGTFSIFSVKVPWTAWTMAIKGK